MKVLKSKLYKKIVSDSRNSIHDLLNVGKKQLFVDGIKRIFNVKILPRNL